ncbi:unnamed protein product [Lymnaea stagnalis]|uniref:Probable RNA-binding protein EIF1AD n=1 Tax=Lymnaea stagnalis TaxID=6523 RepID=A0AAV2HBN7_LYMST
MIIMSATTKKKHVTKEVLEDYPLPEGKRQIVKVTAAKGNNLHEVVTADGESFLVSMPTKFRKHVWIKRGDFIMIESIDEGDKVKGEITHILFKDQIKNIQQHNLWPKGFSSKVTQHLIETLPQDLLPPSGDEGSDDDISDLVHNMNRVQVTQIESESEDSCSEEEEEEEKEEDGATEEAKDIPQTNVLANRDSHLGV